MTDLLFDSKQFLHMVAKFVSDDIGLRKFTRSTHTVGQFVKEPKVEVDLLITGAIERARADSAAPHPDEVTSRSTSLA